MGNCGCQKIIDQAKESEKSFEQAWRKARQELLIQRDTVKLRDEQIKLVTASSEKAFKSYDVLCSKATEWVMSLAKEFYKLNPELYKKTVDSLGDFPIRSIRVDQK